MEADQSLYSGATITLATSVILLISYAMRHSLTGQTIADRLVLIDLHCLTPNLCQRNMKTFMDFFRNCKSPLQFHYYCENCSWVPEFLKNIKYVLLNETSCVTVIVINKMLLLPLRALNLSFSFLALICLIWLSFKFIKQVICMIDLCAKVAYYMMTVYCILFYFYYMYYKSKLLCAGVVFKWKCMKRNT